MLLAARMCVTLYTCLFGRLHNIVMLTVLIDIQYVQRLIRLCTFSSVNI